MERKRTREEASPVTFSSNEEWFIEKLGRDVWKHKVLEFLLPSRRTQFRKAWFLGVVWDGILDKVLDPLFDEWEKASKDYGNRYAWALNEEFKTLSSMQFRRIPHCFNYHRLNMTEGALRLVKADNREDYVSKLFPTQWSARSASRRPPRTNASSSSELAATSGSTAS